MRIALLKTEFALKWSETIEAVMILSGSFWFFRNLLALRDSLKTTSGLLDPTKFIAVLVLIPYSAPANARDKNQSCFNLLEGRIADLGNRGSFFAAMN